MPERETTTKSLLAASSAPPCEKLLPIYPVAPKPAATQLIESSRA